VRLISFTSLGSFLTFTRRIWRGALFNIASRVHWHDAWEHSLIIYLFTSDMYIDMYTAYVHTNIQVSFHWREIFIEIFDSSSTLFQMQKSTTQNCAYCLKRKNKKLTQLFYIGHINMFNINYANLSSNNIKYIYYINTYINTYIIKSASKFLISFI